MTLKPVPLHKHPRVQAAKLDCLAMLKDMERRVRAGEIESIAAVMVTRDGRALHQRTEVHRIDAVLGGITRLEHAIIAAAEDVDAAD
jgi:hypothetical protein